MPREFQEDPPYRSPGPVAYKPDITDPGRTLSKNDKMLTRRCNFLEDGMQTMPKFPRETIFSGNFKHYLGKDVGRFDKDG